MDTNSIINTGYHASVLTAGMFLSSFITKKVFQIPSPKVEPSAQNMIELAGHLSTAIVARDFLVKKGIIPQNIHI